MSSLVSGARLVDCLVRGGIADTLVEEQGKRERGRKELEEQQWRKERKRGDVRRSEGDE
jgi:hypothetical protein